MNTPIYLDNAATTCSAPEVLAVMARCAQDAYGNASAIHRSGTDAAREVERSRGILARALRARPDEIVFTGGGTEANNMALKGAVPLTGPRHVITTAIEHPSVLEVVAWLERTGAAVTRLAVDNQGRVDPTDVRRALRRDTVLVSVMHGNNEVGTLEAVGEIGRICREAGVLFHTDACQSFVRESLDVGRDCIDLLSMNAHKLHGPKGTGALFVRDGVKLEPLFHGGGQEGARRSGTLNTPAIAGFGKAVELIQGDDKARMTALRDALIDGVLRRVEEAHLTGPRQDRLSTIASFVFARVAGKDVQRALDRRAITVSTGSACHAGSLQPSHVLLALGIPPALAHGAVRLSVGRYTTAADVDAALDAIEEVVRALRQQAG